MNVRATKLEGVKDKNVFVKADAQKRRAGGRAEAIDAKE